MKLGLRLAMKQTEEKESIMSSAYVNTKDLTPD